MCVCVYWTSRLSHITLLELFAIQSSKHLDLYVCLQRGHCMLLEPVSAKGQQLSLAVRVCGLALAFASSPHDSPQPCKMNSQRQILSNTEQTLDSFYWGLGFFLWARSFGSIWQRVCPRGCSLEPELLEQQTNVRLTCYALRDEGRGRGSVSKDHHSESICSGCQGQKRDGGTRIGKGKGTGGRGGVGGMVRMGIKLDEMSWPFEPDSEVRLA